MNHENPRPGGTVLLGVDVGGTTMSAGLVTTDGEILAATHVATHGEGPGTAVDTLLGVIARLLDEAGRRRLAIEGIGVGLPGPIDVDNGTIRSLPLIPEVDGVPLAARITAKAGIATFVDNDVNALALGEWMFGVGRQADPFVLLAIGSGVGGGIIVDGRLVRGKRGYAGEFGHIPVDVNGEPCECGGRGCLMVYTGGHRLAAEARDRVRHEPSSILALAGGRPGAITTEMIFRAAAGGDALARGMVDRACRALGAGLAGIVNGLNPEVVVVTGGVVESLVHWHGEILARTGEYALAEALATTRIHLVPADKRQTMRGGAALVLYEKARRSRVARVHDEAAHHGGA
jgi:glucokinase